MKHSIKRFPMRFFALSLLLSCMAIRCADKTERVNEPNDAFVDVAADRDAQQLNCISPSRSGYATYYDWANGGGNCLFDPTPNDLMVGAMNPIDYAGSAVCGSYVSVKGPKGSVNIRIVDQCDIDLSPAAFSVIADLPQGRVPIKWKVIPYPAQGNIVYHFKEGSNQWWTAVQIRNHRYPIARFEYMTSGGIYKTVRRQTYNYFVETTGMGPGPFTFRVTDAYGHVLVDGGVPHVENGNAVGAAQFPLCASIADQEIAVE
jgi:expansin (peptidoglycan-binding protein)